MIEAYFGGDLACELETAGAAAFFDFAADELVGLFGADFRRKISPLASHGWRTDRWAMGSYSYARPGKADSRGVLAASVDDTARRMLLMTRALLAATVYVGFLQLARMLGR